MPTDTTPAPDPSTATAVLLEAFGRTPGLVDTVLDDLPQADLTRRIDPGANTIAWLVWHTARMHDAQVTGARRTLGERDAEQVWTAEGFRERFGLDVDDRDVGYGMTADEVADVVAPPELLREYHQAVVDATTRYLSGLDGHEYAQVVDANWDPPVTLLARLVSVEQDAVQHLGQAAYVKGVLHRS